MSALRHPGAIGYSVSPAARGRNERLRSAAASAAAAPSPGIAWLAIRVNSATNTAVRRDEREGFPKTPRPRHQTGGRHPGREIEWGRVRGRGARRGGERSPGVVPSSQGSVQVSLEAGRLVS